MRERQDETMQHQRGVVAVVRVAQHGAAQFLGRRLDDVLDPLPGAGRVRVEGQARVPPRQQLRGCMCV